MIRLDKWCQVCVREILSDVIYGRRLKSNEMNSLLGENGGLTSLQVWRVQKSAEVETTAAITWQSAVLFHVAVDKEIIFCYKKTLFYSFWWRIERNVVTQNINNLKGIISFGGQIFADD